MIKLVRLIGLHNIVAAGLTSGIAVFYAWSIAASVQKLFFLPVPVVVSVILVLSFLSRRSGWAAAMTIAGCGIYFAILSLAAFGFGVGLFSQGMLFAGASGVLVAVIVAAVLLYLSTSFVKVHRVQIRHKNIPPELDGFVIAHISDLHLLSRRDTSMGLKAAKLVNAFSPDMVCITGDVVDERGDHVSETAEAALEVITAMSSKYGTFSVLGNHDIKSGADEVVKRTEGAMRILRDEVVDLETDSGVTISIAGIEGPETWWHQSRMNPIRKVQELVSVLPKRGLRLLLSHFPEAVDYFPEGAVDIVLAGHTHGGQIGFGRSFRSFNLAWPVTNYMLGEYEVRGTVLTVTPGLGLSYYLPIRLGIWPEVTIITLKALADS